MLSTFNKNDFLEQSEKALFKAKCDLGIKEWLTFDWKKEKKKN